MALKFNLSTAGTFVRFYSPEKLMTKIGKVAVRSVWMNLTPETKSKAQNRLGDWFGTIDPAELPSF